jgi:hypothetical protein
MKRLFKKLVWRIKYTMHISQRFGERLKWLGFCWRCSGNAIKDWDLEDDPIEAADEELSYWND